MKGVRTLARFDTRWGESDGFRHFTNFGQAKFDEFYAAQAAAVVACLPNAATIKACGLLLRTSLGANFG